MYQDTKGKIPVYDFVTSCDPKMKAKLLKYMELLEEYGKDLRSPYSEYLEEGIFELRVKVSSNISRVLYFFIEDKKIVMTNGFIKKTQKTPRNEIELAKKRRKDYLERR